jgi:hypothetical protein
VPADPRLAAAAQGAQDPQSSLTAQRLADLERRVAVLERTATIQTGSGAPTNAARDGTLYVDTTNSRLYVRSSSAWKFVAVT